MKCSHCLTSIPEVPKYTHIGKDKDGEWFIKCYDCPECKKMNLFLLNSQSVDYQSYDYKADGYEPEPSGEIGPLLKIRPQGSARPPCPKEVPNDISDDYNEACIVMPYSIKASAALSRRCLEALLRKKAGVTSDTLFKGIQQAIDSGSLPSDLEKDIDAVRKIGNLATHPMEHKITGEIIPVEPKEAEWTLNILEDLFDFYYVKPIKSKKRRDDLNEKYSKKK